MFKFYIYKIAQFIVNHLSLEFSYQIAILISKLHYYFSFRDRRSVKNNLKIILRSEENLGPLAKDVFCNFGKYLVDFFRMRRTLTQEYIQSEIEITNIERIEQALEAGRGGIIITAHIGNWELGAAVLSMLGFPLTAIALPHKERPVNDLFNAQREACRMTVVPSHLAVRKCMETLKDNRLVALVADRDFSANGEVLDFLGRKAFIPKGAAVFSAKTGAAIIPVFLLRKEDDTYILSVEEPIYPEEHKTALSKEIVERTVLLPIIEQYKNVIEKQILKHPTQWLMFREFWTQ